MRDDGMTTDRRQGNDGGMTEGQWRDEGGMMEGQWMDDGGMTGSPHLNAALCGLADRLEVRDDVRHQVGAHLHRGAEVVLQQAARQLRRPDLGGGEEQL